MRSTILIVFLLIVLLVDSLAQSGNHQINIGVGAGIPIGYYGEDFKPGVTSTVKGLYGVGKAGQVGFATGIARFTADIESIDQNGIVSIEKERNLLIPFATSYRHHISRLYIEPQVGFEFISDVVKSPGIRRKYDGFFFLLVAAGIGYILPNNLEVGFRYQHSASEITFVNIQLAYNFNIKRIGGLIL